MRARAILEGKSPKQQWSQLKADSAKEREQELAAGLAFIRSRDGSWTNQDPERVAAEVARLRQADHIERVMTLRHQHATEKQQRDLDAAQDPNTPPEVLRALVQGPDNRVMLAAARNRNTPIDAVLASFKRLKKHLKSSHFPRRIAVASGAAATERMKRKAREALGAHPSTPVVIVLGSARPPRSVGRSYYWTTPSGKTEVQYPMAYGWPTEYHHSTRRIVVGAGWFNDPYAPSL